MFACQFHPEKSGLVGQQILKAFMDGSAGSETRESSDLNGQKKGSKVGGLSRRVIACLDVRANDNGDLVVTKVGCSCP